MSFYHKLLPQPALISPCFIWQAVLSKMTDIHKLIIHKNKEEENTGERKKKNLKSHRSVGSSGIPRGSQCAESSRADKGTAHRLESHNVFCMKRESLTTFVAHFQIIALLCRNTTENHIPELFRKVVLVQK